MIQLNRANPIIQNTSLANSHTFICLVRSRLGKYNSGLFGDVDELKNKIKKQQKINMIESPITKYSNTIMCNTSLYSIFKKINTLKCKLQHC